MSYTYEALSPGGHQEMLEEVFSKVREQVGSYKTASGSLVSFSDGADLPMPSFICDITANQDLHGYDAPWVGGAGKNKYPLSQNINLGGANDRTFSQSFATPLGSGTYTVSWKSTGDATPFLQIERDGAYISRGNGSSFSVTGSITKFYWYISNEDYNNNKTIYIYDIQLESGTTATSYAPYSNICPISGHTGVDAWVRGKNLFGGWANNQPYSNSLLSQEIPVNFKSSPDYTFSGLGNAYNVIIYAYDSDNQLVGRLAGAMRDNVTVYKTMFNANNEGTQDFDSISYLVVRFYNLDEESKNTIKTYQIQAETGDTITTYEPYNPNSQTIQVSWQTEAGEVYGGYVDLVSGELTVVRVSTTINGNNINYISASSQIDVLGGKRLSTNIANAKYTNNTAIPNIDSDRLVVVSANSIFSDTGSNCVSVNDLNQITLRYKGVATQKDAQDLLNAEPIQIVYELATPITYQLTPTQIKSLLGNNNAWCSTGDIKSLQYQPNNIIAELRDEILSLQEWGFSPIIYSTEEREVGVWYDNKPLYEKGVIITGLGTSGGHTDFSLNVSNAEIKTVEGCYWYSDGTTRKYGDVLINAAGVLDTNYTLQAQAINNNTIRITYTQDRSTSTGFVRARYTKTTDVAGSGSYNTLGVPTIHYTTDEQVIGTWFGKPLYQKCYDNLNITVQDNKWNNLITILNGQDCIGLKVWGEFSEYFEMIPTTSHIDSTNGQLEARFTGLDADRIVKKIMVQYTKTTD